MGEGKYRIVVQPWIELKDDNKEQENISLHLSENDRKMFVEKYWVSGYTPSPYDYPFEMFVNEELYNRLIRDNLDGGHGIRVLSVGDRLSIVPSDANLWEIVETQMLDEETVSCVVVESPLYRGWRLNFVRGGCVEIEDNQDGYLHVCDYQSFVGMLQSFLPTWKKLDERYN